MPEEWDVVVVGPGPAGSSAALPALQRRPRCRVLLLDREEFPRDKCCGDAVTPHTAALLGIGGGAAVLEDGAGLAHRRTMRQRLARHWQAASSAVGLARWPVLARLGLHLVRRDQGVFDCFVHLGLGDGQIRPGGATSAAGRLLVGRHS